MGLAVSLQDYVAACYPLIHVQTTDYESAIQQITTAIKAVVAEPEIFCWKSAHGLAVIQRQKHSRPPALNTVELAPLLSYFQGKSVPYLILQNAESFLEESAQVVDLLIELAYSARAQQSTLFCVGPSLDIPELASLRTTYVLPLPSQEEIYVKYRQIVEEHRGKLVGFAGKRPRKAGKGFSAEQEDLIRRAAAASVGLSAMAAENALALSLVSRHTVVPEIIQQQREQEIAADGVLEFIADLSAMEDVGGFARLKAWVRKRRRIFSDEAARFGISPPKGVLICGIPGSGKSLAAKAIGAELGIPVLRIDVGAIFRSYVGESEQACRNALRMADTIGRCVLWLDEIDKAFAGMHDSDSGVTNRVLGTILTWRAETKSPVLLVATANSIQGLPSMVYRKGRIDEVFFVDLPTADERAEILSIHLRKRGYDATEYVDDVLVGFTDGWVGSELEALVESALIDAFDEGQPLTRQHLHNGVFSTVAQKDRDDEEIAAIRRWAQGRAVSVS